MGGRGRREVGRREEGGERREEGRGRQQVGNTRDADKELLVAL